MTSLKLSVDYLLSISGGGGGGRDIHDVALTMSILLSVHRTLRPDSPNSQRQYHSILEVRSLSQYNIMQQTNPLKLLTHTVFELNVY